jgi:histidinol-phosphate phosphatase family protein
LKPCAVLFDRDETIVIDVPFNGDPERVQPAPEARRLLDRLRAAGLPLAVVSNQSGVGRGLITLEQVHAVNRRIDELLGPFAGFFVCPHAPEDDCDCRKPKPKLILDAARALGVDPRCCVVVGDRESDVEAARNAGATPMRIDGAGRLADAVNRILALVA